jgi:hypothetical protein
VLLEREAFAVGQLRHTYFPCLQRFTHAALPARRYGTAWRCSPTCSSAIANVGGTWVAEVAWQLGVKPQEYREIEAGKRSPDFETWDRICKFYG